ncbi:MAG: ATP-binding protein [Candidatus Methanoplasma sp.]|jgi:predicted AAA+ superfamily ATPase|nr:ATP-binding protein [Candidatus Methanoplasma sp.]
MREVLRAKDLERLDAGRDRTDVAKIITGIRRCGKSTLMRQFMRRLADSGVRESDIFYLNLESGAADDISDFRDLNRRISESLPESGRVYVFLDEVQRVEGWERTLNSLMVDYDADVYVTGSNAYLLSSELSTYISGRYVEIDLLPLSFREYLELYPPGPSQTVDDRFGDYVWKGSMPMIDPDADERFRRDHLAGICDTILNKDVIARNGVRDAASIDSVMRFLFSNIGNVTSRSSISKHLRQNHSTVGSYLRYLEEAYILYDAGRFDIVGNRHLQSLEKYYAADTGMRNAVLGSSKGDDLGRQMENIVYLELRRRGYSVSVGSYLDREVDFTAERGSGREYFQVALTMAPDDAYERETRSLSQIGDSFPKTILTADRVRRAAPGGIRHLNIVDWLLSDW